MTLASNYILKQTKLHQIYCIKLKLKKCNANHHPHPTQTHTHKSQLLSMQFISFSFGTAQYHIKQPSAQTHTYKNEHHQKHHHPVQPNHTKNI